MVGIGAMKKLSVIEKPNQVKEYSIYQGTTKVGTVKARTKEEARNKMFKVFGINVKQRKRAFNKYLATIKSTGKR